MAHTKLQITPIPSSNVGRELAGADGPLTEQHLLNAASQLPTLLDEAGGLLIARGLKTLRKAPKTFLELSEIFGNEVENVRKTLTAERFFHDTVPELMVLSNQPPCGHPPPPKPSPNVSNDGTLVVSYPHQTNWHTDQSYRRPPPDITLLYAITTPPPNQGQTLFADCAAAYAALPRRTQERIKNLNGIHVMSGIGRSRKDVENDQAPRHLLPHQLPQSQPLVRIHPVTGRPSLYLCDSGQMDFVDGPIEGLSPGPNGQGAALIDMLLCHVTQPKFVYAHEWRPGDLVIGDNRCLLHAATWYDADAHARLLWRTTVRGNPGPEYAGEARSWIPINGAALMDGLTDV